MSEIGTIKTGRELGYKGVWRKHIYQPCLECGKLRWVRLVHINSNGGEPICNYCHSCRNKQGSLQRQGNNSHFWKGGRTKTREGYIGVKLYPNDFFYPMAGSKHYVPEHRLVMAQYLNRCLLSWEIVHHKNGIKDDNRIGNLELLPTVRQHLPSMVWRAELARHDKRIQILESKVEEQSKLIKLLQWETKEAKREATLAAV